jgi:WS/DGAT/MGAT family acyltransferase
MIEMSGSDAYFFWEESRARHMHTLKVIVVDPSSAHAAVTFERVREGATRVMPRWPAFRRRAVAAPLGIGHPFWVNAPAFDPDYHLRHEVLPPGSRDDALDELLGRIASEPLDRDRPLWQVFFVEGLAGGRVAYVTKLHHSVADGPASAALVLRTFQAGSEPAVLPRAYEGGNEPIPSAWYRLLFALSREALRLLTLPGLLIRSVRAIGVSLRWRRSGRPLPPPPFSAPAAAFNRPITPNRVYAHAALPLADLREVKKALDCTVNDVFLAVVGGVLRTYLADHGDASGLELTAAVPVSVRREQDDPLFGNATAYWFATTASHVADPIERVGAVARSTRAARAHFAARDPRLHVDWLEHWPLRRLYVSDFAMVAGALARRPSYNLIVSNVRGPSKRLFVDGARVEALYSMGPLASQQGLNFTAWSYLDAFTVGVHACREQVPDVRALADALPWELESLKRAVRALPRAEGS